MEHVVFFPAHDGSPAFRRLESLEDAVRFVEHLRNVEGVDHVSVHALTEVPLAFKAYYRVEMPADAPVVSDVPVAAAPVPVPEQGGEPAVVAEVAPAAVDVVPALAEVPVQELEQPTPAAKASMGFFSRG